MRRTTGTPRVVDTAANSDSPASELVRCLADTQTQLRELLRIARDKLEAMRTADVATLNACTRSEVDLLQRVYRGEQQRNAVVARLAQTLPGGRRRELSLNQIAGQSPEPVRSRLQAQIAGLRTAATELKRENDLNSRVARDLQRHIRGVFSALGNARRETAVYGQDGQHHRSSKSQMILDATG